MEGLSPQKNDAQIVSCLMAVLDAGKTAALRVTGTSMLPFLRHLKDTVELEKADPQSIRRGDIVFFCRCGNQFVLHRVRGVRGNTLVINGDHQRWTERIEKKQVIGRVVSVRRDDGRTVSCRGPAWRLASALWYPTRPFRPWLFCLAGKLRRLSGRG